MPRKAKAKPEAETTPVEAMPEAKPARGAKTKAIKAALKVHKDKTPKEIAEILTAEGLPTTASQVSNVKFLMGNKRKAKAEPTAEVAAEAPAVPKDAVSVALMQRAKKLAAQLGGIKEAKQAIDALSQLMD
jgi:hypothetical protein